MLESARMSESARSYAIVLTTAGSEEQATTVARELVERRLAACVNIVGQVCSVYRWKGEVRQEEEWLLLIKTAVDRFPEVRAAIRSLHSYETPEVVMLPLADADPDYLTWLAGEV